jgi:hypothetical protein
LALDTPSVFDSSAIGASFRPAQRNRKSFFLESAALGATSVQSTRFPENRYSRLFVVVSHWNPEPVLHLHHPAIDFLDLSHERFFALGKFDQLSKRRAWNISQHFSILRLRSTMQLQDI